MNSYGPGSQVKLEADFKTEAGVLTNPTTVTVKVSKNFVDGLLVDTTSVTNPSTGHFVYYYQITNTDEAEGVYFYRFEGAGGLVATPERDGAFIVTNSQVLDAA